MNWMIYPAAKAFIRACTFLFGAGVTATVLIHLFMPLFLHCPPDSRALPAFGNMVGTNLHPGPVFPPILGKQGPAGFPGEQDHKNSKRAGLPARPVLPPHSVCGDARLIAIRGNGQGLGVLPPSGGHHFFLFFPLYGGYGSAGRRTFLAWGIAAAGCGLQSVLFFLSTLLRQCLSSVAPSLATPAAWLAIILSCGLEILLAALSVILVRRLFKNAMSIASMPELMNPSMPDSRP